MKELTKTIESDYLLKIQGSEKFYNQILHNVENKNCTPEFQKCILINNFRNFLLNWKKSYFIKMIRKCKNFTKLLNQII